MIQGLKLLDVICTSTMYECSRRNHALLLSLPRQLYVTSKFSPEKIGNLLIIYLLYHPQPNPNKKLKQRVVMVSIM